MLSFGSISRSAERQNLDRVDVAEDGRCDLELTDNAPGQGDLPDHAALAAFQRHNVYNAAVDVDCCRCDGEDFGNPAASQT